MTWFCPIVHRFVVVLFLLPLGRITCASTILTLRSLLISQITSVSPFNLTSCKMDTKFLPSIILPKKTCHLTLASTFLFLPSKTTLRVSGVPVVIEPPAVCRLGPTSGRGIPAPAPASLAPTAPPFSALMPALCPHNIRITSMMWAVLRWL